MCDRDVRGVSSGDEARCDGDCGGSGASERSLSLSDNAGGVKSLSTDDLELDIEKKTEVDAYLRVEGRGPICGAGGSLYTR